MPDVLTASALEARIRHCYEQLTEAVSRIRRFCEGCN